MAKVKPEVAPIEAPKTLDKSIEIKLIDRNKPTYSFNGQWSARDVRVVLRTIVREYRLYQLAIRRQFVIDAAAQELSDEKVTLTPAISEKGDS